VDICNVVVPNKNLALYMKSVKPFLTRYEEEHQVFPSWEILQQQDFMKGIRDARRWMYELVRRYNVEWKDETANKKNRNYCPKIGDKLKERYIAIDLQSGKNANAPFSEEQVEQIVELL
jgi:hypothetical protein